MTDEELEKRINFMHDPGNIGACDRCPHEQNCSKGLCWVEVVCLQDADDDHDAWD